MATIRLPKDFKEFLQFLDLEKVEYLLVGGFAVGFYGHPRATGDMDIWVAVNRGNAEKLVRVLQEFGFSADSISPDMFLVEHQVFRMGVPPLRIDLLTNATGLDFADCYTNRNRGEIDGAEVNVISLGDLKTNKKACGRPKDLNDLENLP